jgi:hypothetical protein
MLSWSNRLKQEERYEQDRCANNQDHNEQSKSSGGSSARESQAAARTTVVDRRGTLMQHRECQREDENECDGIREVALAEQMNTRGTALRAIHHHILADSAPTSNEREISHGKVSWQTRRTCSVMGAPAACLCLRWLASSFG